MNVASCFTTRSLLLAGLLAGGLAQPLTSSWAANWPGFRNDGSGIASETKAPVRWSPTEKVRWRTELPEKGNSSPVVWGDKVFLTQNVGNKRSVLCLDRLTGKILWRQGVVYDGKETTHDTNPYCSASPVTDGQRLMVWFGSAGLVCYDLDGKELWRKDLGQQSHIWGYGSSPVLHGDVCILYFGPGPRSFLTGLEKSTGRTLWQVEAPERHPPERFDGFAGKTDGMIGTWSTPLLFKSGNRDEVVMTFPNEMRSFDPLTGRELWKTDGLNPLLYTSPLAGSGYVVGLGGFFGGSVAVKAGGSGDLSGHKVWSVKREKRHLLSSGIIKGKHIFISNTIGVAECRELQTGKQVWEERLKSTGADGETWGSMILVGENLYVMNRSGDVFVLRANPEKFDLVAVNSLKELANSTPAVANGELFLRTHQALWCIGESAGPRASLPGAAN